MQIKIAAVAKSRMLGDDRLDHFYVISIKSSLRDRYFRRGNICNGKLCRNLKYGKIVGLFLVFACTFPHKITPEN